MGHTSFTFRHSVVLAAFLFVFAGVLIRLFYWQVIAGVTLAEAAIDQYYFSLDLPAKRGVITDSEKGMLVGNQTAYLAYAEPPKIESKKEFALRISELLEVETEEAEKRLETPNVVWVPLKHKVNEDVYNQLLSLDIDGLGFEKEGKRLYPEASMAAHLFGFVGSNSTGADTGYFGLEGYYNLALRGKPGSLLQEKDARGVPILLGDVKRMDAEDGKSLELFLDRTVQFIAEENLKAGLERYGAVSGLVAIMDPYTGAILASAAYPNYTPGSYAESPKEYYPNPLIANTYEPGSTFKAFVMAGAFNERAVSEKTVFKEEGPVPIGEYLIRTWNNEYNGELTMTRVLEKSSNPGMVFVGKQLGEEKLLEYIHTFGFGKKTGIDLEEEADGTLRSDDEWGEIDLATASFGQGIAVTPIQMVRAMAVLANGGTLIEPHVVQTIISGNGQNIEIKPKKITQVIRPATAKTITTMLVSAVDNGEAKWAKPAGYRIAGKTGTAQIPVAGHYDSEKTIASFIGYAPADDPKFVMLVLLREPQTSPWGSETAAPLFFQIAKELFSYYGISPGN